LLEGYRQRQDTRTKEWIMRTNWCRWGGMPGVVGLAVIAALALGTSPADAGKKDHGYMGVYMQKLSPDVREGLDIDVQRGVLVSGVQSDSPAEKAGLEDGDVIIEVAGRSVHNPDDLRDLVWDMSPGDQVEVLVIRDGDRRKIGLTLGEAPDQWSYDSDDDNDFTDLKLLGRDGRYTVAQLLGGPRLGVQAAELNEDLAGYFDTKPGEGILVLEVMDESIAEEAGVKAGDVITKVDDNAITDIDDLRESLKDYDEGDTFEVTVLRKGRTKTLEATMNDQSVHTFFSGQHPRVHIDRLRRIDRDDIDKALDELRQEVKKLKREIEELKDND
jgi:serine protease Do